MTQQPNQPIELDNSFAGEYIGKVCERAAALATSTSQPVHFVFNDTHVTIQPGESATEAESRWHRDYEAAAKAWRDSPEYAAREKAREEEHQRKLAEVFSEPAQTEAEMRDAKVPWPYTQTQLTDYIRSLVSRSHDYGTCVYAMSMAATAAFYYVAHELGVTGFQSSCADLDILRRTRSLKGPLILLKGEDALYPQYDLPARLAETMEEWKPWLKEQAEKKLVEDSEHTHPDVIAHWKKLAAMAVDVKEEEGGVR